MTDNNEFQIAPYWSQAPDLGEVDVAEIRIALGELALIQIADIGRGQLRDFVRASSVSLGFWFTDNWWRLRWETMRDYKTATADWRLRHELTSVSGGTTWPPLMIYGVGARVVVAPIAIGPRARVPVSYVPAPVSIMPGQTYEAGVDAFLKKVLENCARAKDGKALKILLNQLNRERKDPELAAWRRLEATLGYDPDDASENLIESLTVQERRVGTEAVEEAAASSPGATASTTLAQVISASEASTVLINLTSAVKTHDVIVRIDPWKPVWLAAENAAAQFRKAVGRAKGPILNKAFGDILAIRWQDVTAASSTAEKLPYGAWLTGDGTKERIALQAKSSAGRRFELARVIGDALLSRNANFGLFSRARTDRQKFQRAFAQSLLCPLEDLQEHIDVTGPTDEQIKAAAKHFHVHETVVRTLLVNKSVMRRETLDEALEAA